MIRSPQAPQPKHDNITRAASSMQRSAGPDAKLADTTAQNAATSSGRSEEVTKLNAAG